MPVGPKLNSREYEFAFGSNNGLYFGHLKDGKEDFGDFGQMFLMARKVTAVIKITRGWFAVTTTDFEGIHIINRELGTLEEIPLKVTKKKDVQ